MDVDVMSDTKWACHVGFNNPVGWAFRVVKEFHVITLHALIDVCLPPYFTIVDLNCGTCTCIHPSIIILDSKLIMQFDLYLTFVFDGSYRE
jgi:hypothetical protein